MLSTSFHRLLRHIFCIALFFTSNAVASDDPSQYLPDFCFSTPHFAVRPLNITSEEDVSRILSYDTPRHELASLVKQNRFLERIKTKISTPFSAWILTAGESEMVISFLEMEVTGEVRVIIKSDNFFAFNDSAPFIRDCLFAPLKQYKHKKVCVLEHDIFRALLAQAYRLYTRLGESYRPEEAISASALPKSLLKALYATSDRGNASIRRQGINHKAHEKQTRDYENFLILLGFNKDSLTHQQSHSNKFVFSFSEVKSPDEDHNNANNKTHGHTK